MFSAMRKPVRCKDLLENGDLDVGERSWRTDWKLSQDGVPIKAEVESVPGLWLRLSCRRGPRSLMGGGGDVKTD